MKVVGLLSGGKDSVYNLVHCVVQGHEPVAVASLGPPEGKDELDSYMYQTVGHSGLAVLAQALDLPFFVRTITGTAVNQRGEYGSRTAKGKGKEDADDETEDLYELLKSVKEAMPDVQGVSVGAILSNYQRVRVEHVCARLGLTPLAYLWERSQPQLLAEMIAAGMESVLVKVAGAGLQVKHLGQSLAQMQPTLHKLNGMYDLHVCGEGGEYETFTVDCPLFKRRVLLDQTTTVVSDSSPFSTVAHLHLDSVSLSPDPKPDVPAQESFVELQARIRSTIDVGVPPVLDEAAQEWEEAARRAYEVVEADSALASSSTPVAEQEAEPTARARRANDGWLYVSEIVAPVEARRCEIEEEVRACFEALEALLSRNDGSLLQLAHLTVYLSPSAETMALFPRINAVYSTYFGTSPPTRACVAVPGPQGAGAWRVKLDGVARVGDPSVGLENERKALHVQSMSYWAPANIGPYSQSVNTGGRIYIAGQIPLIPAALSLPPSPSSNSSSHDPTARFSYHAALALQHLTRIVACSSPASTARPISVVAWLGPCASDHEWRRRVAACRAAWSAAHGEDALEGFVAVEAAALPRGAEVEWQAVWSSSPALSDSQSDNDEAGDDAGESVPPRMAREEVVRVTGYRSDVSESLATALSGHATQTTVFYRTGALNLERMSALLSSAARTGTDAPACSFVPVTRLATASDTTQQYGLIIW
ncbi:hypothetical protein BMF94_4078 [Rhodotorula taiwanensis]|uniref:Diphthine--ammonia ligase n=1 Tax=Rhodotorula taiwanensis TaxID=741276 RepID=A0A2S5B830_9BASI|nr:hypothetical protein BMF94_4078 [Rhodotorula taiwanensis]